MSAYVWVTVSDCEVCLGMWECVSLGVCWCEWASFWVCEYVCLNLCECLWLCQSSCVWVCVWCEITLSSLNLSSTSRPMKTGVRAAHPIRPRYQHRHRCGERKRRLAEFVYSYSDLMPTRMGWGPQQGWFICFYFLVPVSAVNFIFSFKNQIRSKKNIYMWLRRPDRPEYFLTLICRP
jgi:hypothetical protein